MKRSIRPLETLGLSIGFYVLAVIVGYDSLIGAVLATIGLVLLVLAIIGGIKKLVRR